MKKFVISDKCSGCGLCFSVTDLVSENSKGIAEVVKGAVISDDFYAQAQEIVKDCPEGAISIEEAEGYASVQEYVEAMTKKLQQIPSPKINREDIKFDAYNYSMNYGSCSYSGEYSSDSQAERAGLKEFDRVAYSQYRPMILEVFVQYRNDKLKPFYTLDSSGFYAKNNKKYIEILEEIVQGVKAYSNSKIQLPSEFTTFGVLPGDNMKQAKDNVCGIEFFHERSTCSGIMEEFRSESYSSLSSYEMYIDTDERETYGTGRFGRDKWITKYSYTTPSVLDACRNFEKDLKSAMNYVDIDESALYFVNSSVDTYNNQVKKVVNQKIDMLRKAVS